MSPEDFNTDITDDDNYIIGNIDICEFSVTSISSLLENTCFPYRYLPLATQLHIILV